MTTLVAIEVEVPFLVGLSEFVADAKKAETEVVVSGEYFDRSFAGEH